MNFQPDFFIYDNTNYINNSPIQRNKTKSNWNMRKTLQQQKIEPLILKGPSQTSNTPHIFKSIYDINFSPIDNFNSDLKNMFLGNEQLQSKLIAPSINVNLKKTTV